jgi:hypothetical protein
MTGEQARNVCDAIAALIDAKLRLFREPDSRQAQELASTCYWVLFDRLETENKVSP